MPSSRYAFSFSRSLGTFAYRSVGTIFTRATSMPFDLVKLRLQLQPLTTVEKVPGAACPPYHFRYVYRQDGLLGFWCGAVPGLLRVSYLSAFVPAGYKSVFAIALLVLDQPLDVARVLLVADETFKNAGTLDCLRVVYEKRGLRGLFAGLTPLLVFTMVFVQLNTGLSALFNRPIRNKKPNRYVQGIISTGVLLLAGWLTYPADTVRRALVLDTVRDLPRYAGVFDCARQLFNERGLRGLYAGAGMNAVRSLVASSATAVFETLFGPGLGSP